jgi:CheY-like chemotaxis protein
VKQILTFSRKGKHQLQMLEPYHIVKEVVKMLHSTLPSTVSIEQELDSNAGWIEADPTKIHQILVNLCTNAFQSMEGEKGVLQIFLERREIEREMVSHIEITPGTYIILQVSDNGHGMDEETQKQIFNPFFSTKEIGTGTGLGLSVLHGIVKDYVGHVEVESVPGEGSCFRVYLPAIGEREIDMVVAEELIERETSRSGEEILVVDDDPLLVRLNSRILSDIGYRVTQTVSSEDALEKIRNEPHRFDLLITDQTMPQLTGAELAAKAMKIAPEISVILCTGHSGVISEKDALAMGICRYVYKPVQGTELIDIVRGVLEERNRNIS